MPQPKHKKLDWIVVAIYLLLVIFGWMKLINRASWLKSIVVAVLATVAIYLIFGMWLRIPFPGLI